MRWLYGFSLSVATGLSPIACDTHTGPSTGITVFEHPDFGGDSRTFDTNARDLRDIEGPCGVGDPGGWSGCISSIRVTPGLQATVYSRRDYGLTGDDPGESLLVMANIADLEDIPGPCRNGWDDCIQSIQIHVPSAR